jgi:beta-glucosidase
MPVPLRSAPVRLLLLALCMVGATLTPSAQASSGTPELSPEAWRRVDDLLERMTVKEKVGQMTQLALSSISSQTSTADQPHILDEDKAREAIVEYGIGSVLNAGNVAMGIDEWRSLVARLQSMATEQTRLGVPLIYGIDSVHGGNYIMGATLFPHNLTLAATFDPELSRLAGEITAAETRAAGLPWNFAPVCDVARAPAWSRVFETFGEDPHLAGVMAAASVVGQQGDDLASPLRVAATAKHFLGYSDPRTGRDRTPANIPDTELFDTFLPPFEATFDAGVRTIMVNSSEINGVPVHASPRILRGILRERAGFEGVVVTDWSDVLKLRDWHRVAETEREATRLAVEAGIDMAMTPLSLSFADTLVGLVEDGVIAESRLDESVRRILALKMELGLFEQPLSPADAVATLGTESAHDASLAAARAGVTLLRNTDDLLPLAEGTRILVCGPAADDLVALHGSWTYTWQGTDEAMYPDTPTLLDAVRERFGEDRVAYQPGATWDEPRDIDAAAQAAAEADVVLLCLGEEASAEKPGDILDLAMSDAQLDLARALGRTGTPVVLVLLENRPRLFTPVEQHMDAVLWAGHPGPHGGRAIAEILAGDVNPSGRLPFTYPRDANALLTYDHKYSERFWMDEYTYTGYTPMFAFGEGLSYTSFGYSGLSVRRAPDGGLTGEVIVTNTGDRAGDEAVLVYLTDEVSSITPRVRRLKWFDKVSLEPGARATVRFDLPREALTMIDAEGRRVLEPGAFTVRVGGLETTVSVGE